MKRALKRALKPLTRSPWAALVLSLPMSGCVADVVAVEYLAVINVAPPHGAAGVSVETTASVTFSMPLDEATVEDAVYLEDTSGAVVDAVISYDRGSYTVHVRPRDALFAEEGYTLVLSDALASEAAGNLAAPLASSFTTAGATAPDDYPPIAVIADPGAGCAVGEAVTLDGAYSYDPEGDALSWSWDLLETPAAATAGLDPVSQGIVSLIPDVAGDWLIGLTVSDGEADSAETYVLLTCADG